MQLLENPGRKLKTVTKVCFILDIITIAIAAILCIVIVPQFSYESGGIVTLIVIVFAASLFLAGWVQALFIIAYADMADQLKRQTEILERIEGKGQPLS